MTRELVYRRSNWGAMASAKRERVRRGSIETDLAAAKARVVALESAMVAAQEELRRLGNRVTALEGP